jgi:hypothetical protein
MTPTVVFCPACHAMQPARERCGVCGATLPVAAVPQKAGVVGPGALSVRERLSLAGFLLGLLGGIVLAGVLVLFIVWTLLG